MDSYNLAEVTSLRKTLATAHAAGFDEDDIAANRSPNEADGNAWLLRALVNLTLGAKLWHAEEFANDFRSDDHLFRLAFGYTPGLFTGDGADFALEIANAGFAREAVDDLLQAFIGELDLFADFQAVFGGLLRNQIFVRDVKLFFPSVARKLNDLHAVAQWFRNRIHPV